ncbi:MAG: Extracellular lipase, Pla/cef family [Gammaproteobacteria bacterium]|nr:Extracellular lipase, Pla/cef family [Gammaproteobacteria bacterium]
MDKLFVAALAAAASFVCGCSGSDHGSIGATNTTSGNGNPGGETPVTPPATTTALFQPLQGILPYPTDLYFAGSTDGTLNIQPANALMPNQAAVNALDGFSTTAVIRAGFGGALNPASFTASSVIVVQVTIDNTTKATTGVVQPLVFGTDYTVGVGPEAGVGSSILEIRPVHPLVPSTGVSDNGYLVILTNGITDASGKAATPDTDYANIKAAQPTCSAIADSSLNGICKLTGAHLQIAHALGIDPANIVLSFSFTTQATADTMAVITQTATAQPLSVHNTGLTTAQANPLLKGHATIYLGTLSVPYYLSRTAPLTGYWQGNPSHLDASSRFLTRFNPVPVPTETLLVPVLVTVPNAASLSHGTKPASGWPVLVFEHGITRNRTDMLAVADSFADGGFVVVAIDLPLHGITDQTNPFYASGANPLYAGLSLAPSGSIERTFDLDVVNNTTGARGADGHIDPSGTSFINLTSLLTSRDNLREAAADLITLTRSLPNLNLDTDPAGDVDPTSVHYLGHSLGAIVGGVYLGATTSAELRTGTLAMPGGGIAALLRDSPTFGPRILAGLQAGGLQPGTTLLEQFFRDAQTVIDSGDPLNYIATAARNHPVHVIQVVGGGSSLPDQVVPNSATQRLIAAGALTRIAAPAAPGPLVSAAGTPPGQRGYVDFIVGDHGSIIDPTASPTATAEMQTEAISFAISQGTAIQVAFPSVMQP